MSNSPSYGGPPSKKLKMNDSDSDEDIPQEDNENAVQKAIEEIDSCQNEIDSLTEESSTAILAAEQKYNKVRKPLYDQRSLLIEKLDKFWVTVLVNHPHLTTFLDSIEEDCLQYLHKFEVEEFADVKMGFKLKFFFEPNPYIENDVIIKELCLNNPVKNTKATTTSTPIRWKEGKNLVQMIRDKRKNKPKKIRSKENTSFFEWFNKTSSVDDDEIAEVIKDDIWPNPLQYYLSPDVDFDANAASADKEGKANSDEDDDDDGEEEEEEDEEGEEAETEDDDDKDKENVVGIPQVVEIDGEPEIVLVEDEPEVVEVVGEFGGKVGTEVLVKHEVDNDVEFIDTTPATQRDKSSQGRRKKNMQPVKDTKTGTQEVIDISGD